MIFIIIFLFCQYHPTSARLLFCFCVCFTKGVNVTPKMIEREKREHDKSGAAPTPYIIVEREGEICRMEYGATPPALVANNRGWGQGHYTEGAAIIDQVVDMIRNEAGLCDCPQGFEIAHSLGDSTGSGLDTLLSIKIRDNHPHRITATFSVYPSSKVLDVVAEQYNETLSIHQLLEHSDETFHNAALYNISHNTLKHY